MTLEYPVLELDADFGSGLVTGVFELYGDVDVTQAIRTGYLVGGRGSSVNGIFDSSGDEQRKGVHLDLGGGQHTWQVKATGWKAATKADGSNVQWGTSSDPTVESESSATGAKAVTQMDVFCHFLSVGTFDSQGGARLRYGEHSDGTYAASAGSMDPYKTVAIESPQVQLSADSKDKMDVSMTLIDTMVIKELRDAKKRKHY